MVETFGEQDGFAAVTPSPQEAASTDKVTVGFHYLNVESFEVTTDELVDLAAALYTDARNARSAGMGGMWAVGFQEARLLVDAHRSALTPVQLGILRQRLDAAGYYQQKELRDPYGLGPLEQAEAENT